MGLQKIEWLFISSHNYWIVCRLVKHDEHSYLVYSQAISVKDSSEPFRVFLSAILSVIKGIPVDPSPYNSNMDFDTIEEENSRAYQYRSGGMAAATRSRRRCLEGNTVMVRPPLTIYYLNS